VDDAEILRIRGQFQAGLWPQFLEKVGITGLRGWTGQSVQFNFPVVAVVGENGTGKSTLLKTAACAYEGIPKKGSFYPSSFFVNTHWDRIHDVKLNYQIKQGTVPRNYNISKLSERWSFPKNRAQRAVRFDDISRTVPLDASVGYARIAKVATSETASADIQQEYRERLSHVLGREYQSARFATSDADAQREIGILGLAFGEISQFHQGAGEAATLDLFQEIQNIPANALLIIDEVEASLHPRAQRRLVRFLLWLSRKRRIQVILSTHSPYVLEELPSEARILLLPGPSNILNIIYGITPEFALSRIDESVHPDVNIFVEDNEAAIFLREILASGSTSSELIPRIHISTVGPGNVILMLGKLASERKLPYRSLAFIDADYAPGPGCIVFPGNSAPERVVYQGLKDISWDGLVERFGLGAGTLMTVLDDAMLEPKHHKWNAIVGDKILKSSNSVWETLSSQWAVKCLEPDERERIAQAIRDAIDTPSV
jgi:predicted ATPase